MDTDHKSLENTAVLQLTAVLSNEMPWDNIGISSKNILNTNQCSEEHVLKCTFKACDPEETGKVSVFRIIEYLQEMTGQSYEDWRFQSLYHRLDPEERGLAVDFSTFYAVMRDWIADCRQEVEEAADLTNSIKDLQYGNKQLVVQNIKLQKTIEAAEELNSRLSEEISELKRKLRGSQQALEQTRILANELEDLKVFSKSMEEENRKWHTQVRQLEKEQQLLFIQVDKLQDENKKLLLEKENSKCKFRELFTKEAKMKSQLCECENILSCKDAALNEKTKQAEELKVTLDEYRTMAQELKLEVNSLQELLCQFNEDPKMLPTNCLQNPQPIYMEIEESQKQQETCKESGLTSPLCGMLHSLVIHPVAQGSITSLVEEQDLRKERSDDAKLLFPTSHSLFQLNFVPDGDAKLKLRNIQQQNHLSSDMGRSIQKSKQSLRNNHPSNNKMFGLILRNSDMGTCSSNTEAQMVCFIFKEIMVISSAKSIFAVSQEDSFISNNGNLIPIVGGKCNGHLFEIFLRRFLTVPLGNLLLYILQKLVPLGLLLVCVPLIAIFCLVVSYNQYHAWTEPKGNFWPLLQLQYLHPPPF